MNTQSDINTANNRAGATCYAVFVRKSRGWVQESIPFDSYADAQNHAKLTRRARPFAEMTRVRRIPHNTSGSTVPPNPQMRN
jgi:hypothetical protein